MLTVLLAVTKWKNGTLDLRSVRPLMSPLPSGAQVSPCCPYFQTLKSDISFSCLFSIFWYYFTPLHIFPDLFGLSMLWDLRFILHHSLQRGSTYYRQVCFLKLSCNPLSHLPGFPLFLYQAFLSLAPCQRILCFIGVGWIVLRLVSNLSSLQFAYHTSETHMGVGWKESQSSSWYLCFYTPVLVTIYPHPCPPIIAGVLIFLLLREESGLASLIFFPV